MSFPSVPEVETGRLLKIPFTTLPKGGDSLLERGAHDPEARAAGAVSATRGRRSRGSNVRRQQVYGRGKSAKAEGSRVVDLVMGNRFRGGINEEPMPIV